jgi:hypothetical protein
VCVCVRVCHPFTILTRLSLSQLSTYKEEVAAQQAAAHDELQSVIALQAQSEEALTAAERQVEELRGKLEVRNVWICFAQKSTFGVKRELILSP